MRRVWSVAGAVVAAVLAIVAIEVSPLATTARLLECLVLAALCGTLAWMATGRARDGLVMACSLFAGLALIEGGVLVLDLRAGAPGPAVASDSHLSQPRPLVGWGAVKPGVYRSIKTAADGHTIFDTRVTIDDTLNRKTVPSSGERPIVFFGDSWIYGDGVDDGGTLPQAFADLNHGRIPVLNLSFAGWSPAQNLIALREGLYAKLIVDPRHFILFTSPFHLERTACRGNYATTQAPRFVREGDDVRYVGPCASRASPLLPLVRIARRFAVYQRLAPMLAMPRRGDVETYLAIIEAFVAQATRDYGVRTTVVFAPYDEQYLKDTGFTGAEIVDALRKAGLDVLVDHLPPIADPSRYQIAGDGHPTALANEARAREIEAHLREVDPAALEIDAAR